MRYWYYKGTCNFGHSDFQGFQERIYKGEEIPKLLISRFQDDREKHPKPWQVIWEEIEKYNPVYYPHTANGMTEITEEEFEKIINSIP